MTQASVEILTLSSRGRLLKYDAAEIPCTGLSARGVKAMKLSQKERLVKSLPLHNGHDVLILTSRGTIKRLELSEIPKKHRTQSPTEAYKPLKTKSVDAADMVLLDAAHYRQKTDLFIVTSKTTVKTPVFDLKLNGADLGKAITQPKHGDPLLMRYAVGELAPENTPLSTYVQSLSEKSPQQLSLEVMDDLLS
jgi:DNA gyrase/topoisomerase IV subunit A